MKDLVVVIPGIMGSVLRRHKQIVWGYGVGAVGAALLKRGWNVRDALVLQGDDPLAEDLGDGITADALMPDLHLLPGFWKIDGYSAIARTLCGNFNLLPGRNYFEFPYDWRRDNRSNARKLATAMHTWLAQWRKDGSADARVVVIAHSMGGLVARYYLEVLGGWREGSTRALITIGTPFRGSLNALNTLVNGVRLRSIELPALSEFCRSLTSIYQLLPIFPAYDSGDGKPVRVGETSGIPQVDAQRASAALAFHNELREAVRQNRADARWEADGYETYPVVGQAQVTSYLGVKANDAVVMTDVYSGKTLDGDGTVPRVSAIPLEFDDTKRRADLYAATKHGSLQNAPAVLDHITGRVNDLYTDFGGFRAVRPAVTASVALEVDDLVHSDEQVLVRLRPSTSRRVAVHLFGSRAAQPLRTVLVDASEHEWHECRFEPLAEGEYRVSVSGNAVFPAEEAFAVVDATRADAVPHDG